MENLKREASLKISIPMNQSIGPGPVDHLVNTVNNLTFPIFCAFPRFVIPLPFSDEISSFFYTQCQGNFHFWSKINQYLSICLYDAYDMKFMQSKGTFIKNS